MSASVIRLILLCGSHSRFLASISDVSSGRSDVGAKDQELKIHFESESV